MFLQVFVIKNPQKKQNYMTNTTHLDMAILFLHLFYYLFLLKHLKTSCRLDDTSPLNTSVCTYSPISGVIIITPENTCFQYNLI
jgi:hypothetical protein